MRKQTLQESVQQRKERPTHHKQQKGTISKHKNKNNRTCENCDPMKLELSYSKTQQRKAWPQTRGRESTLTLLHICHRTRNPVGHVLIERRCVIKHCKRGCNKEKKDQPTTNNKKHRFKNTETKNNKTSENCDPMKLELSYIQKHNNGRRGHIEGERVHLLQYIVVTAPVFQLDTS